MSGPDHLISERMHPQPKVMEMGDRLSLQGAHLCATANRTIPFLALRPSSDAEAPFQYFPLFPFQYCPLFLAAN